MLRTTLFLLALASMDLRAQWQLIASGDQLPTATYDGCTHPDGSITVLTNESTALGYYNSAFVHSIGPFGSPLEDTVHITSQSEPALAARIYRRGTQDHYFVTGALLDSSIVGFENRSFVGEVDNGQIQMYPHGSRFHEGGDGLGFVAGDGSLVYGYYHFQDFATLDFNFRAVRHCPGLGACDSSLINSQIGTGRVQTMVPLADGTIATIMPAIHQGCSPSNDGIVILNQDLDTLNCLPIPIIESGMWNTTATFDDNLTALRLASGNILLCGVYERIMSPDWWHPVAIQRLTPEGDLLASRRFYNSTNPAITMRPGIMRGMSPFDEGTFAFAYADFAWQSSPWPYMTETSNIHVLRMDTALNILGEYIFNGDAINRYHFLSSVVASPDGAVYVVGSVYDHDADDPMPKAWVARVGPEQFVSVPEVQQAGFSVFPNPGADGFHLRMANPLRGAHAYLRNAQGSLLREMALTNVQTWIDACDLPVGLYILEVADTDGNRTALRWVKE
ncbi:MAG: T9SS type A sorting domain-containing protein [Flavobacteriales bacterium]|nr:T9SS type A sorting domain-containing protein [Flavobacteriales bacterium]